METENDPKPVKTPKSKLWWVVAFIFALCGASIFSLMVTMEGLGNRNDEYNKLAKNHQEVVHLNEELNTKLENSFKELTSLKTRLAGIKDNNDLLMRDIELYIIKKYRKVPQIVAASIAEHVVDKTKDIDISAELIIGIIQVESQFNPSAVGPKTKYGHARGLMQVMPAWAKEFKLKTKYDLHNIPTNIAAGIRVFQFHLNNKKQGNGSISEGLYYYVNKDRSYVGKVYEAMGEFVSFRSTVGNKDKIENGDSETTPPPMEGEKQIIETDEGTEDSH